MSELDTSGFVEGLGRATSPVYSTDVEELLRERGVTVTYEAIRKWCRKFGQQYTNQLRRRRPQPGDKWHLDEMLLTIKGMVLSVAGGGSGRPRTRHSGPA